jgi:hypothetical protein
MLIDAVHQILFKIYGPYYEDLATRIARDCNINYKTLKAIMTKTRAPSFETFMRICEKCKVTFIMTPGEWRLVHNMDSLIERENKRIDALDHFDGEELYQHPDNVSKVFRRKRNFPNAK